jgi:predicted Zn finger-like uncharacterized protein
MRLVCPNCEAKYEVPEDAIPETGRDVQCANCGHSWYQMRPRAAAAETAPAAAAVTPPPVPEQVVEAEKTPEPASVLEKIPEPEPEPEKTPDPVPEPAPEPEVTPVAAETADPVPEVSEVVASVGEVVEKGAEDALASVADTAEVIETAASDVAAELVASADAVVAGNDPAPVDVAPDATALPDLEDVADAEPIAATGAAPAAYAVDDSVLAILREEAEREASARRAEAAKPLEVQADLGIEAAMPAARMPAAAMAEDDRLSARRTKLPDVEEINSTLRPGEQPAEDTEAMPLPVEGRSSFRKGFLLVMTFAILGAALYVSAGALSNAVPALAGFLEAYVGFINSLRLQLDGLMQSATLAINGT